MSSVCVRYNGRREQIKLTSRQMAVHLILKEACRRYDVEPSSFGLRSCRNKKGSALDTSLAWAHTGLSNNCELDLIPCKSTTKSGLVRVACSVDGEKTTEGTVSNERSLLEAVRDVTGREAFAVRVVRQKFEGKDLGQSLASLGYGPNSSVKLNVDAGAAEVDVLGQAQPRESTPAHLSQTEEKAVAAATDSSRVAVTCAGQLLSGADNRSLNVLRRYASGSTTEKKIRLENATFKRVSVVDGVVAMLEAIGFERGDEYYVMRPDGPLCLELALRLIDSHHTQEQQHQQHATRQEESRSAPSSAIEREVAELRRKEKRILEEAPKRPERRARLYRPSSSSSAQGGGSNEDQPLEEGDLALLAAAMKSKPQEEEELTTRAVRELRELRKKKVYATLLLKFSFPDGFWLTATFGVAETVSDAKELVSEYVQGAFKLVVPRVVLREDDLLQQFAPAAVFYVQPSQASYLKAGVTICDDEQDMSFPRPVSLHEEPKSTSSKPSSSVKETGQPSSNKPKQPKKMAWLKLGGH